MASIKDLDLSEDTLGRLGAMTNCNVLIMNGGMYMDSSRRTGHIIGNNGNNQNIMGDDVTQFNIQKEPKLIESLEQIKNIVSKIDDKNVKSEAELYSSSLESSIEKEDTSKIKVCLTKLREIIGDVAGLATIASFFGLGIPGLV